MASSDDPHDLLRRVVLLLKALYLPLLALGFIAVSFASFALFSGVTRTTVWVERAEGVIPARLEALQRDEVIESFALPGEAPVPPECPAGARRIVAELDSFPLNRSSVFHDRLAEAGLVVCSAPASRFNVAPAAATPASAALLGWPQLLIVLVGAAMAWHIFRRHGPQRVPPPTVPVPWFAAAAATVVLIGGTASIAPQLRALAPGDPGVTGGSLSLVSLLVVATLIPFLEELSFRAWMIPLAGQSIGTAGAVAYSTAVFTLTHEMYDASHMLTYTLAGLVLAGLWLRTRSLTACVLAHGAYNAWIALGYAG
ncbi:MAG TPA: type II CAAX endopeptidase family protein [Pseudoxanthomonas sp.]|nr:type II CAAX endopeptidase family protein [Pseudoxanthomonas sp.]